MLNDTQTTETEIILNLIEMLESDTSEDVAETLDLDVEELNAQGFDLVDFLADFLVELEEELEARRCDYYNDPRN